MSQARRTQHFARSAKRREEKNKAPVTSPQVVVLRSLESGFHMVVANLKLLNQAFYNLI